ncbi:bifunctional alpha,alpha-trehalose-phosphate synthase (UDP-forming)/trehalose-phosphatase [Candidatus Saccharibacteria bacterium]|nr:MAG: bifunctional alpha,alpha-trehalose-phosphate synthase (UDP-forming)/trehalose-phosphatase [Candidatus Saccharibacteria bacterium]
MPKVVIVSNRLPVSVKKVDGKLKYYPSAGGLATGLSSYANAGANRWIGWPGIASDDLTEAEEANISKELKKSHCYPVFLTQKQLDGFYNGYSNSVLWPLFHHMQVSTGDTATNWRIYTEVNRKYAEATLALSKEADRLWLHDYQLMLLPEMLRVARPKGRIGFFLHIPFPSPDLFLASKHAASITKGLLGADLVGMHTSGYTENFLSACHHLGIGVVGPRKVVLPERVVRVTDLPIGIDYKKFADASRSIDVSIEHKKLLWKYRGRKVILTIDRLDPSKGLVGRLKAYRVLIAENPELRGKVVMVMQAMPSRTEIAAYQQLRVDVEKLVQQINTQYGTRRWQPVEVIFATQAFAEYAALYQRADVAFIAPIRDGMNLVAKEYLASHPKSDGILVLSETAGAAEELKDAVLVNPYKLRSLVSGLSEALNMTPGGFLRRTRKMQKQLRRNTIDKWASGFIDLLERPIPTPSIRLARNLGPVQTKELVADYHQARKRLILFDYDGTLEPIKKRPQDAEPSRSTIAVLKRLAKDPRNHVAVISGRDRLNLMDWLGSLPITLVAEHGGFIRLRDHKTWRKTNQHSLRWEKAVTKIFKHYAQQTPGAFVERKEWSLAWHYRNAAPFAAQKNLVILKKLLRPIAQRETLGVVDGNMVLEVHHLDVSKGHITQEWLLHDQDFILAIGDDTTDEDMFAALPTSSYTIKVGRGRTLANYRLPNSPAVHHLLRKL